MHKLTMNRMRLDLHFAPQTPLLIKSGDKGLGLLRPDLPDLAFVRTAHAEGDTVYIPGASIKGVVRSAAERVIRSVGRRCCDPLQHKGRCQEEASKLGDKVAERSREAHPQAAVHRMVCYACRTFGSQAIASRVAFADAYPPPDSHTRTNATERRHSVAIDRKTGGPSGGKLFEVDVVTGGSFVTAVELQNVQLWQVGLLGIVLADIAEGFVRFGSAKSRGFGYVKVSPVRAAFEQVDPQGKRIAPAGVASLRADLAQDYGLLAGEDDALSSAAGGDSTETPLGRKWVWQGADAVQTFLDACAGKPWKAFCANADAADGEMG